MEENERAIPEWMVVKREILWSHYEATKALARYFRNKIRGINDQGSLLQFKQFAIECYLKIRIKTKEKDSLREIDKYLLGKMIGKKISTEKWIAHFFEMQRLIERLGLTKIEKKQLPPDKAILEGSGVGGS